MYGALCGLVTNAETAPKVANLVPRIVQVSHVCHSYALIHLFDSMTHIVMHLHMLLLTQNAFFPSTCLT